MSNRLGMFLLGGVVGAAAALLYAPRTGVETRALVADKANEAWGAAQHYGAEAQMRGQQIYNTAVARGQEVAKTAVDAAQETAERTTQVAQNAFAEVQDRVVTARDNVRPVIAEKNDELREKIDAARERIASQVAKNAAETKEVLDEAVSTGSEVVEDVVSKVESAVDSKDNPSDK